MVFLWWLNYHGFPYGFPHFWWTWNCHIWWPDGLRVPVTQKPRPWCRMDWPGRQLNFGNPTEKPWEKHRKILDGKNMGKQTWENHGFYPSKSWENHRTVGDFPAEPLTGTTGAPFALDLFHLVCSSRRGHVLVIFRKHPVLGVADFDP